MDLAHIVGSIMKLRKRTMANKQVDFDNKKFPQRSLCLLKKIADMQVARYCWDEPTENIPPPLLFSITKRKENFVSLIQRTVSPCTWVRPSGTSGNHFLFFKSTANRRVHLLHHLALLKQVPVAICPFVGSFNTAFSAA
jgi:hypothetical protein